MSGARERIEWLLGRLWFRGAFAALLVAMHVLDTRGMAASRFQQPFDRTPESEPVFRDPLREKHVENGKRLAVARWDAEHYIAIALRGYVACPIGPMTDADIRAYDGRCTLTFLPGYSMLGRTLVRLHAMPMDYALFYLSLLATFLTFLLWTGPTMVVRFGYATAWISLIALNAHPASCYLVYVGTEACALFFTFMTYLAFAKRRFVLAAILAGMASAMRISGVATSVALCIALVAETWRVRPRGLFEWIARLVCFPLSAWGLILTLEFFSSRFDDPFIYKRAHEIIYNHHPSFHELLDPQPAWIMHAIDSPVHDGVWVVGLVLWFMLGYRLAFKHVPVAERFFMHGLVVVVLGLSIYGSLDIFVLGLSRYALVAFPLFLGVAALLRSRPIILVFWLSLGRWHSTEADVCYYVGDVGPTALVKCNMTQWVNW